MGIKKQDQEQQQQQQQQPNSSSLPQHNEKEESSSKFPFWICKQSIDPSWSDDDESDESDWFPVGWSAFAADVLATEYIHTEQEQKLFFTTVIRGLKIALIFGTIIIWIKILFLASHNK